jgi:RNA-directed DNA polymerase
MPTDVKFQQLNRVIRGWGNYYRHVNFTTTAKKVDWWLNERVLIWLKDKHKGMGVRRILQQYKVREKKGQNERYNFASTDDKGTMVYLALLSDIRLTKYYWKKQPNPYLSAETVLQQPETETPFVDVKDMQFDGDNAHWQKQRRRALKRDNYRCKVCNRTWDETSIHVHHLIPKHEGGQDTLDNLVTLCEDCHISTPTFGRKPQATREESSSESRMR